MSKTDGNEGLLRSHLPGGIEDIRQESDFASTASGTQRRGSKAEKGQGSLTDVGGSGIPAKVSVQRLDYMGNVYSNDSSKDQLEINLSTLKLVNVPTMFDIGCTQANPATDFLSLSMIDTSTYKIIKSQFLSKKEFRHIAEIERLRLQMQSLYSYMHVSKVVLEFPPDQPLIISEHGKCPLHIDGIPFSTLMPENQGKLTG